EMLRQDHTGLHHMQVVDLGRIDRHQGGGQQIGLLLVVAFQADPIARTDDRLEQRGGIGRLDYLALGQLGAGFEPGVSRLTAQLPRRDAAMRLSVVSPVGHAPDTPRLRARAVPRGVGLAACPPRNFSREVYLENATAAARMGSPAFSKGHDEIARAGIFRGFGPVYDRASSRPCWSSTFNPAF